MVASLLRALHGGIQDSRLLPPRGQPDISMFRKVFYKAGRFTTQWVRIDFDTAPNFGTKATVTLPRKGHLISKLYLVTTMPDIYTIQQVASAAATLAGSTLAGPRFTWTNSLGHALVQEASVEIGGNRMEVLDGRLMEVLDEFYTPLERVPLANTLLGRNISSFPNFGIPVTPAVQVITPLPFWFSRGDPGVYLPIDAIAVDLVRLSITFSPAASLYVSDARLSTTDVAPAAGAAYFPLEGSIFFRTNPAGVPIYGLTGDPAVATLVTPMTNVQIPNPLTLGETYLMAEYVYLDAPEANRFRISDIEVPVVQHYAFDPYDSRNGPKVSIPLRIPNPTRNLFFYVQRYETTFYNAPFLATRDLSGADGPVVPWWPNAGEIATTSPGLFRPGFVFRDSEPLKSIMLIYEGQMLRYATTSPSIFRSLLPSTEMKKAPYVNRYYYSLHFGLNHGQIPLSQPSGEGNLDKITKISLDLEFKPFRGCVAMNQVPRYIVYTWAETYNIFRVYGGRGGMLFAF